MQVWVETADGRRVPLGTSVSLGRSPVNHIPLDDELVSRRHALIHAQGHNEFRLVDLGSRNGTYLNERRVQQPIPLRDGDRIRLGGVSLTFRQNRPSELAATTYPSSHKTLVEMRAAACWLLVADVIGSTTLSRTKPQEEMSMLMGQWFLLCKHEVETAGGLVNKYLGDGFLAYWDAGRVSTEDIVKCLRGLSRLQGNSQPPFRYVLHRGEVLMGGTASLGEEALSGPEVNFVFRVEKLSGALGVNALMSEAVQAALAGRLEASLEGKHPLHGFEGEFLFYRPHLD
jgi:adenylate cyclase